MNRFPYTHHMIYKVKIDPFFYLNKKYTNFGFPILFTCTLSMSNTHKFSLAHKNPLYLSVMPKKCKYHEVCWYNIDFPFAQPESILTFERGKT